MFSLSVLVFHRKKTNAFQPVWPDHVWSVIRTSCDAPVCVSGCYRCCAIQGVDTSRGAGRVWSKLRRVCLLIVQHRAFEGFIVFIILLSSAVLVNKHTDPHHNISSNVGLNPTEDCLWSVNTTKTDLADSDWINCNELDWSEFKWLKVLWDKQNWTE